MENNEFYKAWYWLCDHPIFRNKFQYCLDIEPVLVNPETRRVEDDASLNTKAEIWVEIGPYDSRWITHDIDLDCGGWTFEEAILELYKLVLAKYGDYNGAIVNIDGNISDEDFIIFCTVDSKDKLDAVSKNLKERGMTFYSNIIKYEDQKRTWVVLVKKEEVA